MRNQAVSVVRPAVKSRGIESAAVEPVEEIVERVPQEGPVGGGQPCNTAVIGGSLALDVGEVRRRGAVSAGAYGCSARPREAPRTL